MINQPTKETVMTFDITLEKTDLNHELHRHRSL